MRFLLNVIYFIRETCHFNVNDNFNIIYILCKSIFLQTQINLLTVLIVLLGLHPEISSYAIFKLFQGRSKIAFNSKCLCVKYIGIFYTRLFRWSWNTNFPLLILKGTIEKRNLLKNLTTKNSNFILQLL